MNGAQMDIIKVPGLLSPPLSDLDTLSQAQPPSVARPTRNSWSSHQELQNQQEGAIWPTQCQPWGGRRLRGDFLHPSFRCVVLSLGCAFESPGEPSKY